MHTKEVYLLHFTILPLGDPSLSSRQMESTVPLKNHYWILLNPTRSCKWPKRHPWFCFLCSVHVNAAYRQLNLSIQNKGSLPLEFYFITFNDGSVPPHRLFRERLNRIRSHFLSSLCFALDWETSLPMVLMEHQRKLQPDQQPYHSEIPFCWYRRLLLSWKNLEILKDTTMNLALVVSDTTENEDKLHKSYIS